MTDHEFIAARVNQTIDEALKHLRNLTVDADSVVLKKIYDSASKAVAEHRERDTLTVAFVGQYSAGKSTMVSALTGRRDIDIDTDIATDETATYEWNGIELIDTPGLFTERQDHDDITYDAIERADLLIFVVTYMLFDSVTVENFKKLAYELNYRDKMMLVVNKMSDEAGDFDARVASYRDSLSEALAPHRLKAFPLAFIDAFDYVEGIDDEDEFFIEESRFPAFIELLNDFTTARGRLAHLDTPIRILRGSIDDAIHELTRDETKDQMYLELFNRCRRAVREERQRFRRETNVRINRLCAKIDQKGADLADEIGKLKEDEFKSRISEIEKEIEELVRSEADAFEKNANEAAESLRDELKDILTSGLAETYMASIEANVSVNKSDFDGLGDGEASKEKLENLRKFSKGLSGSAQNLAKAASTGSAGGGFLSAGQAAGSTAHETIYNVGKFIGVKFKPWQAVNIAKKLGNFAKVAGPILSVVGIFIDIAEDVKDEQQAKELTEGKRTLIRQFRSVADNVEEQFQAERKNCEELLFDPLKEYVTEKIQEERASIVDGDKTLEDLQKLDQKLAEVLKEIYA